jgi:hypothetical protein
MSTWTVECTVCLQCCPAWPKPFLQTPKILPQPNQQPKTTLNYFRWDGIIIGKKKTTTTATPSGFHYI